VIFRTVKRLSDEKNERSLEEPSGTPDSRKRAPQKVEQSTGDNALTPRSPGRAKKSLDALLEVMGPVESENQTDVTKKRDQTLMERRLQQGTGQRRVVKVFPGTPTGRQKIIKSNNNFLHT